MLFSKVFTGLAMASTAMAALTPQQLADGIKSLTQKSQRLQAPAQSITIVNAPLIVIGQGPFPVLIAGFADIVATATSLAAQFPGTAPITKRDEQEHARDLSPRGAGADLVFNAFRDFVRVHQALLNILIGKAGILTRIPFVGPPVAGALRGIEGVVDATAIFLINTIEVRANDFASEANALGATITITIEKYDGLQL
ncbi:putative uvi-1 protein [Rosellinia necatrix]|uniref:Putative uvi-1 protein n=1 Tax=Rosellinia necatrix TaxID=77044 RepID=A0A1W2TG08_ROSNE|nr:putative uvi-1 protein [Rosellinia necatrix]